MGKIVELAPTIRGLTEFRRDWLRPLAMCGLA